MSRRRLHMMGVALALATAIATAPVQAQLLSAEPDESDAGIIGVEAYAYAYPLVLSELQRRVDTNVGPGAPSGTEGAPMNQFAHQRAFPSPASTSVVRPSVDVLMSTLWYDVGAEPLLITLPDNAGRWFVLSFFDLWMDVFASLGPRTTGNRGATFALTSRRWSGSLPAGVQRIEAPTDVGRIAARIRADGADDLAAVHGFQGGLRAVPLSAFGKADWTPPAGTYDANQSRELPRDAILRMSIERFFGIFGSLTAANPPHANDYPILQRMTRIGVVPGKPFSLDALVPFDRSALQRTPTTAGQTLFEAFKRSGTRVNGWRIIRSPLGTYGTDYQRRQVIAYSTFGADLPEDLLYYTSLAAADGKPLEGSERYTVHFAADQLPPAHAFWSVTLYDDRQMLVTTKRQRHAIGDRDPLVKNADGSIDLLLQPLPPAKDKEANWLPTPSAGRFSLTLRLYWPKTAALDGAWLPPGITAVE